MVLLLEQTPQNSCCQHLCSQGEPLWLSPFPKDSPRSPSRSDLGSFQITASVLRLGACEILQLPFKSRVSCFLQLSGFPTALWLSYMLSSLAFKARCSVGSSCWYTECRLLLFGENLWNCNHPYFLGHLPGSVGVIYTSLFTPPIYLVWFLLYIFSCKKSFLLVFKSFS